MKVGLFITCYIDQLYHKVAITTLKLLEKQGITVHFLLNKFVVANLSPIRVIAI